MQFLQKKEVPRVGGGKRKKEGEMGKKHNMVPLLPLLSKSRGLFGFSSAFGAEQQLHEVGRKWQSGGTILHSVPCSTIECTDKLHRLLALVF